MSDSIVKKRLAFFGSNGSASSPDLLQNHEAKEDVLLNQQLNCVPKPSLLVTITYPPQVSTVVSKQKELLKSKSIKSSAVWFTEEDFKNVLVEVKKVCKFILPYIHLIT